MTLCILAFTACSQEETETAPAVPQQLTFHLYDAGMTRSVTDSKTLATTFVAGDEAGLYIAKAGVVYGKNIKLTFNEDGVWAPEKPVAVSGDMDGMQFYAYYPYSADATFNAAAEMPFADMVSQTVPTDQSTWEAFEKADLMATAASTVDDNKVVHLALVHQRAMAVIELPNQSYTFTNTNPAIEPYVLSKAEDVIFVLGDNNVEPYFDEMTQSYRLLVQAGARKKLQVYFNTNGTDKVCEIANLSQIPASQFAKYTINGGNSSTEFGLLEVGDYYCADGSLVKGGAATLPDNIIGVVCRIGTPETIQQVHKNCKHALVMALNDTATKWGTEGSTTSEENSAGWKTWYADYGLTQLLKSDGKATDKAADIDETLLEEDGYTYTAAWQIVPDIIELGGFKHQFADIVKEAMSTWNDANSLPAGMTSGWYIPSLAEWKQIDEQTATLAASLTAAGGSKVVWMDDSTTPYWSSNLRSHTSNWCYVGGKTELTDRYKGVSYKDSRNIRFVFAF